MKSDLDLFVITERRGTSGLIRLTNLQVSRLIGRSLASVRRFTINASAKLAFGLREQRIAVGQLVLKNLGGLTAGVDPQLLVEDSCAI
jgi:hypothetical protein